MLKIIIGGDQADNLIEFRGNGETLMAELTLALCHFYGTFKAQDIRLAEGFRKDLLQIMQSPIFFDVANDANKLGAGSLTVVHKKKKEDETNA